MSSGLMMQEAAEPVKAAHRPGDRCPRCNRDPLRAMRCVDGLRHCVECMTPVAAGVVWCPACGEDSRWRCSCGCGEREALVQRLVPHGNRYVYAVLCRDAEREQDWLDAAELEIEREADWTASERGVA
jgi:hypothetical protein